MFDEAERRVYESCGEGTGVGGDPVAPGEPTLRGWLRATIDPIVVLEACVEELESRSPGR